MSAGNWCLLESDPGVFSALIREFGCSGAQGIGFERKDKQNNTNQTYLTEECVPLIL